MRGFHPKKPVKGGGLSDSQAESFDISDSITVFQTAVLEPYLT